MPPGGQQSEHARSNILRCRDVGGEERERRRDGYQRSQELLSPSVWARLQGRLSARVDVGAGRNKRSWIRKIQAVYNPAARPPTKRGYNPWHPVKRWAKHLREKYGYEPEHIDFSAPIPDSLPNLVFLDWVWLLLHAAVLNVLPFVLAYLTSYYTPTIGLSCRSITFLLYFLFQIWLSAIWLWDFQDDKHFDLVYYVGRRRNQGLDGPAGGTSPGYPIPSIMTILTLFGAVGSAFTAIFGTIFQLTGVYRNCKCILPVTAWGQDDFFFQISTNSAEAITYAKRYWMTTGVASIIMLIVVCYVGWWYQRHWRRFFTQLIDRLLIPPPAAVNQPSEEPEDRARSKPCESRIE